jgi:hypothetical protein
MKNTNFKKIECEDLIICRTYKPIYTYTVCLLVRNSWQQNIDTTKQKIVKSGDRSEFCQNKAICTCVTKLRKVTVVPIQKPRKTLTAELQSPQISSHPWLCLWCQFQFFKSIEPSRINTGRSNLGSSMNCGWTNIYTCVYKKCRYTFRRK